MPKRMEIGVVTSDKCQQTRRVEIPRLVRHAKYGKILRRRTVCHVHDAENQSHLGDTVEIVESRPRSRLKRWELVRIVTKSHGVDLAAMRAAARSDRNADDLGAVKQATAKHATAKQETVKQETAK
jgi:small subunit ribosomal protein S17